MILRDNPTGHGFVLRDLVLLELFQISHNCVPECMLQAKCLLKAIRDIFFSQYVEFPIMLYFYPIEGES